MSRPLNPSYPSDSAVAAAAARISLALQEAGPIEVRRGDDAAGFRPACAWTAHAQFHDIGCFVLVAPLLRHAEFPDPHGTPAAGDHAPLARALDEALSQGIKVAVVHRREADWRDEMLPLRAGAVMPRPGGGCVLAADEAPVAFTASMPGPNGPYRSPDRASHAQAAE